MKAKLLSKSLLFLALFALVGCGKPGPSSEPESEESTESTESVESTLPVTAVSTAISWDDSSSAPTLDGQVVRLLDVIVCATYSNTRLCVQQVEGNQVIAIEVITAEDYTATFDVKDVLEVIGTISSENGRPQLINATLAWGTGGQEACDGTGPLNYYADFTRPSWDYNIKRSWAGRWTESTWQIATVPNVVAGQETVFHVAFPGENLDVTDEYNYSYLDVIIPALTEEQATEVNEWAAELEVGCGVYLFSQVWFKDYICIMLPFTSFRFDGTNPVVELTGIYDNFADVETAIQDTITLDLPSIESDLVFSWVLDATSYTTELVEDDPTTEVPVIIVTANVKVTDCETALNDILGVVVDGEGNGYIQAHEAEGWYCVEAGQLQSGEIAYVFVNGTLQETEDSTEEEPSYEVVDSTAQMMVYASLAENAIYMEIVPLTQDIIVVPEEEETLTAEQYMQQIAGSLFQTSTPTVGKHYMAAPDGSYFYTAGAVGGENTEEALIGYVQTAISLFVPEDWVLVTDVTADEFDDGTPCYYAMYMNPEGTIGVDITTYWDAEEGSVILQITVFDLTKVG